MGFEFPREVGNFLALTLQYQIIKLQSIFDKYAILTNLSSILNEVCQFPLLTFNYYRKSAYMRNINNQAFSYGFNSNYFRKLPISSVKLNSCLLFFCFNCKKINRFFAFFSYSANYKVFAWRHSAYAGAPSKVFL